MNVFGTALQLKGKEIRSSKAAPWSAQLLGNISSIWGTFPLLGVRLGQKSPDEPIKGVSAAKARGLYGMYPGKVKLEFSFLICGS